MPLFRMKIYNIFKKITSNLNLRNTEFKADLRPGTYKNNTSHKKPPTTTQIEESFDN